MATGGVGTASATRCDDAAEETHDGAKLEWPSLDHADPGAWGGLRGLLVGSSRVILYAVRLAVATIVSWLQRGFVLRVLSGPRVAIAFGTFLIVAEACRHASAFSSLPASFLSLPIHDWIAGGYLIYAGWRARRDAVAGRLHMLAAWAFNASLLCGAFLGYLEEFSVGTEQVNATAIGFVGIVAVLFLISLGGMLGTLR